MKSSQTAEPLDMNAEGVQKELRRHYAAVAQQPAGQFLYPTGRASAEHLQYRRDFLDQLPPGVVDHFVGVGNPFTLGEPLPSLPK
jgi:hypothetical protein